MNQVDQKWWDIIKPPGGQAPAQGMPTPSSPQSPLMNYAQGGGLDRWLSQPRTPGQSSAPPAPPPQAPAPTPAPTQQTGGGTDSKSILQQGYGYHPQYGFISVPPGSYDQWQKYSKTKMQLSNPDLFLYNLIQPNVQLGGQPMGYGDQAQGVGGVAGNGPDGTDGGL